jgi:hypothetical protein
MVTPGCDECLTTWCGLTLGEVLQVQDFGNQLDDWDINVVTTNSSVYLVEPQNQDRRLDGRRRDPGAPRSFDVGGHVAGS